MFVFHRRALIVQALLCTAFTGPLAFGSTLAETTFDTDSYIPFRTNNPTASEITLGVENAGFNFNFGVIEFDDLSQVSASGDKFLVVDLEAFVTLGDTPVGGGPPATTLTPTGSATIKVVGLDSSYSDVYADAGTTPSVWYDTFIGNPVADAEAAVTDAGLIYFDVTDVVDGWLANPSSNHGLGLVVSTGQSVELGAGDDFLPSGSVAPILSSVPEPTSLALLAMGAVGMLRRRR